MNSLNSKAVKRILATLNSCYGYRGKPDYFFFEDNDKLFIVSKDYNSLDLEGLNVKTVGFCLGKIFGEEIFLTIEGTQLIGKYCEKVVSIGDVRSWLRGMDIEYSGEVKGLVIIKVGNDYMGCGRIKNGVIHNLIEKSRLVKSKD